VGGWGAQQLFVRLIPLKHDHNHILSPPNTGKQLSVWHCGVHGACSSMIALNWSSAAPLQSTSSTGGFGILGGGSSSGGGAAQHHPQYQHPASVPEDSVGGDPRSGWQLLTGHDNGQVLVWNAAADSLHPACKLGETGSPVRTITYFEPWGLLCTAHANGELALFARAAHASDWGGSSGLSGAASHALGSAGGSDSGLGAAPPTTGAVQNPSICVGAVQNPSICVGVACVRPKRLLLRAHRSSIVAAGACSTGLVTASTQGTLRLWRAADLAHEADKAGLLACLGRRTTTSAASSALSLDR